MTAPALARGGGLRRFGRGRLLFLRLSDRVRGQLNVQNLFDEEYFSTAHSNNNITPGAPLQLTAGLTVSY